MDIMDVYDFSRFLEKSALIFTILQFLSGVGICYTIWEKKDTSEVSAFPFLSGMISCTLWLKYGILQRDDTIIIVNAVGLTLQIIYILFYYWLSINKNEIKKQLCVVSLILIPILTYLKYFTSDLTEATKMSGLLACLAGIAFCASPLANLGVVIRTRSAESLPKSLVLSTFICTTLWFFYGVLHSDLFIQIPNFLGSCICIVQVAIIIVLSRSKYQNVASNKS